MTTPVQRSRRVRPAGLATALALLMFATGCDGNKLEAANAGVILQNSAPVSVTVTLDGPSFSPHAESIPSGASRSVDIPAHEGDVITVDVRGDGMANGGSSCRVAADMIDGYPFVSGQITIDSPTVAGGEPTILCSSGWQ